MAALLSVANAQALVLKDAQPLPSENVSLAQAHGRVLAAALTALRTQPPAASRAPRVQKRKAPPVSRNTRNSHCTSASTTGT